MTTGRLFLRATIGGYFIGHGTQKLFGWFDGSGLDGATGMFEGLGLHPARANAVAAGDTETAGGAGLVLGAATPLSAAALIGTMLTAIRTVHWANGPWVTKQGYEYNLVLIAACAALAETGPGGLSVDGDEAGGPGSALLALLLGALGAVGVKAVSDALTPPADAGSAAAESAPTA